MRMLSLSSIFTRVGQFKWCGRDDAMRKLVFLCTFLCTFVASASPTSFAQAKKIAGEVFASHPQTIYCQCSFQGKVIDLTSCGMEDADLQKRAHRVEWEHIMAAEHFGQQFECWRKPLCTRNGKAYKGRACCEKIDPTFREMESELYNIWPEVGLVNQARSNYRFGILQESKTYYGCKLVIDKTRRRVEPPDNAKGIVARAYLFMSLHYQLPLSKGQQQLFWAWHKGFPPTQKEIEWAGQIAKIEGYENPYILSSQNKS